MRMIWSARPLLIVAVSGALMAQQPQADPPAPQAPAQASDSQQTAPADPHVFVIPSGTPSGKPGLSSPTTPLANVKLSDKKISKDTKLELIRALDAEIAYARRPLPKLEKGVVLPANGRVEPGDAELDQLLMRDGMAAKKGEAVQITDMEIRDKEIRFTLNGGSKKKHKWYEHVSVGVGGMESAPLAHPDDPNMKGTTLTLTFPKYVPELTAQQVRELLNPLLDFSVKSPLQAYADTLPPTIKKAVLDHKALVGMTHEMVMAAVGRPDQKFRESNEDGDFEDWMYGRAPATVKFLRFKGDELIRIKEMPTGGEAIVRDQIEIPKEELATIRDRKQEESERIAAAKQEASRPKPTLKRAGDEEPPIGTTSTTTSGGNHPLPQDTSVPSNDPSQRGTDHDTSGYPAPPMQRPMPGPTGMPPMPGSPGDTTGVPH
jgi:hypothetical protein